MKHRSVIAFVIVAAALFSLPQLSHDLRALKGAVGARLHRELLHAFLNLPAGEPTSAAPVARTNDSLLASCPQAKSGAAGAKSGRAGSNGRVEGRAEGKGAEERAMIGDPAHDPIKHVTSAEVKAAADEVFAPLQEVRVETAEVAMIVPPDSLVGPNVLSNALASKDVARLEADRLRVEADGLRVAYAAAARFEVHGDEWQRATEDAARKLNAALPGGHEFSVVRDGAKKRVLKLKCGECPLTAPRLPLAPRRLPAVAPQPAPSAPVVWVGE